MVCCVFFFVCVGGGGGGGGGDNVSTQLNKIYKKGLVGLRFVNAELINTP